jgi:glycosyltransferase involved in cell wall biosynthesis
MRILIWSPFVNLGGGIRLLLSLTSALARHAEIDEVGLAIPPESMVVFPHDDSKLRLLPVVKPAFFRWMEISGSESLLTRLSKKLLERLFTNSIAAVENGYLDRYSKDYDVIYIFWPHGRSFRRSQKPIVCTYQDTTLIDFPEILGGARAELERQYALSWIAGVDQLIVSSQTVRENLIKLFGAETVNATVIYHNILTVSSDVLPSDAVEAPVPLPELPEEYLLYPANVNVHKNHDLLLTAWANFSEREKIPLVLLGEYTHILKPDWDIRKNRYWLHDHVIGVVRRNGLQHGRDFYALGYVSNTQLEQIIKRATGVIMASLSEGGGSYPAEEALRYGIPLLCSDIPVMREHLSTQSADVLWFNPLSIESILNAIKKFRIDYAHYYESAQNGMSDQRTTWDEIADQYVQVFKRAVDSF